MSISNPFLAAADAVLEPLWCDGPAVDTLDTIPAHRWDEAIQIVAPPSWDAAMVDARGWAVR